MVPLFHPLTNPKKISRKQQQSQNMFKLTTSFIVALSLVGSEASLRGSSLSDLGDFGNGPLGTVNPAFAFAYFTQLLDAEYGKTNCIYNMVSTTYDCGVAEIVGTMKQTGLEPKELAVTASNTLYKYGFGAVSASAPAESLNSFQDTSMYCDQLQKEGSAFGKDSTGFGELLCNFYKNNCIFQTSDKKADMSIIQCTMPGTQDHAKLTVRGIDPKTEAMSPMAFTQCVSGWTDCFNIAVSDVLPARDLAVTSIQEWPVFQFVHMSQLLDSKYGHSNCEVVPSSNSYDYECFGSSEQVGGIVGANVTHGPIPEILSVSDSEGNDYDYLFDTTAGLSDLPMESIVGTPEQYCPVLKNGGVEWAGASTGFGIVMCAYYEDNCFLSVDSKTLLASIECYGKNKEVSKLVLSGSDTLAYMAPMTYEHCSDGYDSDCFVSVVLA